MNVIALTGGIASGKSTVARLFAEKKIEIIDADHLAHELVNPGTPAFVAIAHHFGNTVLNADGSLNRAQLRKIIFADDSARQWINHLLHPRIRALIAERIHLLTHSSSPAPYCIVIIPLLAETWNETHSLNPIDRVVVVDCDEQDQLKRLMERDSLPEAAAQSMLRAQATRAARLAIADDIIHNNGDLTHLAMQVDHWHTRYLSRK